MDSISIGGELTSGCMFPDHDKKGDRYVCCEMYLGDWHAHRLHSQNDDYSVSCHGTTSCIFTHTLYNILQNQHNKMYNI